MVSRAVPEPFPGDRVLVEWGLDGRVAATVVEVYGPPGRRHVLVALSPDVSGDIVAAETTLSVPLSAVRTAEVA